MNRIVVALVVAIAGCASYGGGRPVHPTDLDAGWLKATPTTVVAQQHLSDCGLAALSMMAATWDRPWELGALEARLPSTEGGVRLAVLRDLAREHGLDAYVVKASDGDLAHELVAHRPVLVGLEIPLDKKRAREHYEVVVALDPRSGAVVTLDPASGNWVRRDKDVFEFEWKQAGNATLVIVGRIPVVTTR
jgi:ABC-type bacteriocin/lantibiotic exporter with double-glycine peptidase domain